MKKKKNIEINSLNSYLISKVNHQMSRNWKKKTCQQCSETNKFGKVSSSSVGKRQIFYFYHFCSEPVWLKVDHLSKKTKWILKKILHCVACCHPDCQPIVNIYLVCWKANRQKSKIVDTNKDTYLLPKTMKSS